MRNWNRANVRDFEETLQPRLYSYAKALETNRKERRRRIKTRVGLEEEKEEK